MVLDMARPRYKESTTWLGMRGRDAVRKLTLKVDILQVLTIDSSKIQFIVNHNSQSDGQNTSAKSETNLQEKIIHIDSLQRKRKNTKGPWYLTLNKSGKNGPMKLRSDFRAVVSMKNRKHHESGEQIEEPISPEQYSFCGIPLQAHQGGTSLNWNWKSAHKNFF